MTFNGFQSSSIAITNAVETPTVSTPDFGISSVNVTPATSQTPSTSQTPTTSSNQTTSNDFSSSTALQPPSNVTPPALSSVSSASNITPPNSNPNTGIPGDASSVTPPNGSTPPTTNTPTSTAVTPPPGVVAPPGTPGIGGVGGVTPPTGAVNTTVTAFRIDPDTQLTCAQDPSQDGCDAAPHVGGKYVSDTNGINSTTNTTQPDLGKALDKLNDTIGNGGNQTTIADPTNSSDPSEILDPGTANNETENVKNGAVTAPEVIDNHENSKHNQAISDTPCTCPPDPAKQNPNIAPNIPSTPSGNGLDHYGDQNPDPVADAPGTWTAPTPPPTKPPRNQPSGPGGILEQGPPSTPMAPPVIPGIGGGGGGFGCTIRPFLGVNGLPGGGGTTLPTPYVVGSINVVCNPPIAFVTVTVTVTNYGIPVGIQFGAGFGGTSGTVFVDTPQSNGFYCLNYTVVATLPGYNPIVISPKNQDCEYRK